MYLNCFTYALSFTPSSPAAGPGPNVAPTPSSTFFFFFNLKAYGVWIGPAAPEVDISSTPLAFSKKLITCLIFEPVNKLSCSLSLSWLIISNK